MARDTRTGSVLEQMVLPALAMGNYQTRRGVNIGVRPGGRKHIVDIVAEGASGAKFLVSLKWQQVSGTAEQKIPFEAICLAEALRVSESQYCRAYLVLGGGGWTLREFYVGRGLEEHLVHGALVNIRTLEQFVTLANQGKL